MGTGFLPAREAEESIISQRDTCGHLWAGKTIVMKSLWLGRLGSITVFSVSEIYQQCLSLVAGIGSVEFLLDQSL